MQGFISRSSVYSSIFLWGKKNIILIFYKEGIIVHRVHRMLNILRIKKIEQSKLAVSRDLIFLPLFTRRDAPHAFHAASLYASRF